MTLTKDQLRKMHGISESTEQGEPSVLARRNLHESAAKWGARWITALHGYFAIFGFIVILLPVFIKQWRLIIENMPVLSYVFHSYSSLSGMSMLNLYTVAILGFARNFFIKNIPGGKTTGLTYSMVVSMELYPKTKKEEIAYWVKFLFEVSAVTLVFFMPFGIIAYFMSIKI